MKQKVVLDLDILYKDGKEIKLQCKEYRILRILQDNLVHRKEEILRKTDMKRGFCETDNLRGRIWKLCKKTGLKIETMKGLGYHLIDRIFVND